MSWLDIKFANLLSPQLPLYKVKKNMPYLANARCIVCGDSKKSAYKARFWVYENKDGVFVKCHNCGYSSHFKSFLKRTDPNLYKDYALESFKEKSSGRKIAQPIAQLPSVSSSYHLDAVPIIKLGNNHQAIKYLQSRKLPSVARSVLLYAEDFSWMTNQLIPEKLKKPTGERIVIPFLDSDGKLMGYQGRAIDPADPVRYISVMLTEDGQKVFGLDRVKKDKPLYILEGPFDSLFFDNAIAMAGSDAHPPSKAIWIYDNEPRSREIVRRMEKLVETGEQLVIWPKEFIWKDVNDAVLGGLSPETINKMARDRTFSGIQAKVKLMEWKRC